MSTSRVPSGVPNGGQFAASTRTEAQTTLTSRPTVNGIEIPDGWSLAPNRHSRDDFVVKRTAAGRTATVWEVASRRGMFQYDVVDAEYRTLGSGEDWCPDVEEAISEAEHYLGLRR